MTKDEIRRDEIRRQELSDFLRNRRGRVTPSDVGLALDSDDDVRPVDEWPMLRAVAQQLQLSHVW